MGRMLCATFVLLLSFSYLQLFACNKDQSAAVEAVNSASRAPLDREGLIEYNGFRPGTADDYSAWMARFLKAGHEPGGYCAYEQTTHALFVATRDFSMQPLLGVNALEIVATENAHFLGGKLGHSVLYFMADGSCSGWERVLVYRNTRAPGLKSIENDVMPHLRRATEKEQNAWVGNSLFDPRSWVQLVRADSYVAQEDFKLLPMFGSSAITVFVPDGITIFGSDFGHNSVLHPIE